MVVELKTGVVKLLPVPRATPPAAALNQVVIELVLVHVLVTLKLTDAGPHAVAPTPTKIDSVIPTKKLDVVADGQE